MTVISKVFLNGVAKEYLDLFHSAFVLFVKVAWQRSIANVELLWLVLGVVMNCLS